MFKSQCFTDGLVFSHTYQLTRSEQRPNSKDLSCHPSLTHPSGIRSCFILIMFVDIKYVWKGRRYKCGGESSKFFSVKSKSLLLLIIQHHSTEHGLCLCFMFYGFFQDLNIFVSLAIVSMMMYVIGITILHSLKLEDRPETCLVFKFPYNVLKSSKRMLNGNISKIIP